jgi:hypothetical protein
MSLTVSPRSTQHLGHYLIHAQLITYPAHPHIE